MKVHETAGNTLNEEVEVFEFHESGARGPIGEIGQAGDTGATGATGPAGTTVHNETSGLNEGDYIHLSALEYAAIRPSSFASHGAMSAAGTEDFSANDTDHLVTSAGNDFTMTISGLSEAQPDFSVELTVTVSAITITLEADATTADGHSISALPVGTHLIEVKRLVGNATYNKVLLVGVV